MIAQDLVWRRTVTVARKFKILNSRRRLNHDPFRNGTPGSDFGRFTSTQTPLNETKAGRVMQFALRWQF
jgi:hypothetical protein